MNWSDNALQVYVQLTVLNDHTAPVTRHVKCTSSLFSHPFPTSRLPVLVSIHSSHQLSPPSSPSPPLPVQGWAWELRWFTDLINREWGEQFPGGGALKWLLRQPGANCNAQPCLGRVAGVISVVLLTMWYWHTLFNHGINISNILI